MNGVQFDTLGTSVQVPKERTLRPQKPDMGAHVGAKYELP